MSRHVSHVLGTLCDCHGSSVSCSIVTVLFLSSESASGRSIKQHLLPQDEGLADSIETPPELPSLDKNRRATRFDDGALKLRLVVSLHLSISLIDRAI